MPVSHTSPTVIEPRDGEFVDAVRLFMAIGGQYLGTPDVKTYGFYFGMQLEEMAEKLKAISAAEPDAQQRAHMIELHTLMSHFAVRFKDGNHLAALTFADQEEMLDGDIDMAWVSVAAAHFIAKDGASARAAVYHVVERNLAKFPNGKVLRDANGKILKPEGWTPPNHLPFLPERG